jgi:hypothetical protein
MIDELINEIKNTCDPANLSKKIRKNKDLQEIVYTYTSFLDISMDLCLRLKYIRQGINNQLQCEYCGKKLFDIKRFCSAKCANTVTASLPGVQKKRSEKTKEFYKNISKERLKEIIEKTQNTNKERYGCVCTLHAPDIAEKKIKTWAAHGYTNPNKSPVITEKIKRTCNEKYGGNAPTSSAGVIAKRNNNNFIKYGQDPSGLPEIIEKRKNTYFNRTGYLHPMENPEVVDKIRETFFKNDGLGKHKKGLRYTTVETENKKFLVQGYEKGYIHELLKKYNEFEIENSVSFMRKLDFHYCIENMKHIYIPDFYIAKENLIIEVKSEYFLIKGIDIILIKAKTVIDKGYKFILEYSQDGKNFKQLEYEDIKNYKEKLQNG